jgi:hypothetical protein
MASAKKGAARNAPQKEGLTTSETLAVQVAKKTLDPGYRAIAVVVDDWYLDCACIGGTVPQTTVDSYAASLSRYSLDPALALLAPVVAALMGTCCATAPEPINGTIAGAIKGLSLDPGAVRVAMALDAMKASCCDTGPDLH